jgi:uncharacterized protein (DUF488 family)
MKTAADARALYTIGHSARPLAELIDALREVGVTRLVSKCAVGDANAGWQQPSFRNYADYAETAPFREGLSELLAMVSHETCAIMCAEAVWWRCHRRIVTDHVLAHGVPVIHLFGPGKGEPASLTPFAVVGADARVSYPHAAVAGGAGIASGSQGVGAEEARVNGETR